MEELGGAGLAVRPPAWVTPTAFGGVIAACAVLLEPTFGLPGSQTMLQPSILPLAFLATGLVALAVVPGHPVGHRLLAVGALHLVAFAGAILAGSLGGVGWLVGAPATTLYGLGFVALFDAMARYPTGGYADRRVAGVARVAFVAALALAGAVTLGGPALPPILDGIPAITVPFSVPVLASASGLIELAPGLLLLGLGAMVVRYRATGAVERGQLRWPLAAVALFGAVVSVAGTIALQDTIGESGQAAVFTAVGSAVPVSFLVGLLQRARLDERAAIVEASRRLIVAAGLEERQRIERDLHDGTQQQLLALLARIELARRQVPPDGALAAELAEIARSVADVHRELRELARGIHPAVLTDRGLPDAVASALDRLPLAAEFHVDPSVRGRRLPPVVEGAAYLFVLESLANVMKHAGAERASVSLAAAGPGLEVVVADDGRGFDPGSLSDGGLRGLRDRVAAVGGRLDVDAAPGAGTRLRGVFPGD